MKKSLTKCGEKAYYFFTLATSRASRDKLNQLLANDSTPILNRAFFVRNFRTPKENALSVLLPMVGRKGQPLAVGCLPVMAVCHPFTSYRQSVTSLAVSLKNQLLEIAKMIYLFLGIHRHNLADTSRTFQRLPKARIIINADSENTARAKIAKDYCLLQCWSVKNSDQLDRTLANVKGVIYAN